MLNYGVLAPLCDPILDEVPIDRATHQVAALHEAIQRYANKFKRCRLFSISPSMASRASRASSKPAVLIEAKPRTLWELTQIPPKHEFVKH